jgi:glycerol-3-phosphate dehydrogenase
MYFSGETWTTKTKSVVNATGPFTDGIRKMDDPSIPAIVCPSSGIHIVLPDYYSPEKMGLLDPVRAYLIFKIKTIIAGPTYLSKLI